MDARVSGAGPSTPVESEGMIQSDKIIGMAGAWMQARHQGGTAAGCAVKVTRHIRTDAAGFGTGAAWW